MKGVRGPRIWTGVPGRQGAVQILEDLGRCCWLDREPCKVLKGSVNVCVLVNLEFCVCVPSLFLLARALSCVYI